MLFDHVGGLSRWDKNSRVLLLMNRLQVRDPINESKLYFVKIILVTFFFFLLIFLYLVTSKDELGSAIGIIICIMYPFFSFETLKKKLLERRRSIQIELPSLLNQWLLRLSSAESLLNVILKSRLNLPDTHPLRIEYSHLQNRLTNGMPLHVALESFSRSCNVMEVNKLIHLVLIHQKNGGDDLFVEMQHILDSLWETKKNIAKKMGEEASSKLVFPMTFIFLILMFILAAPILFFTK
jgi:tight adherence protein C